MAFSSDVLLPSNARYFDFVEKTKAYNSNYDIVWSFQYRVPSTAVNSSNYQCGFSTFLTTITASPSAQPGHYLGDASTLGNGLISEDSNFIYTEYGNLLLVDIASLSGRYLVKIAFDSTGLFGLSSNDDDGRDGVSINDIKPNSIGIRDFDQKLLFYDSLSNISTSLSLTSEDFITLRFRYVNLGQKLHLDIRDYDMTFTTLTTFDLGYRIEGFSNLNNIYAGFNFSTPISSSTDALSVTEFHLKNFHTEGLITNDVLTETLTSTNVSIVGLSSFATVSSITSI